MRIAVEMKVAIEQMRGKGKCRGSGGAIALPCPVTH